MLKRYQVLLEDWQEEYINFIVRKYGLTFSRTIRIMVNVATSFMVENIIPKYYKSDSRIRTLLKNLAKAPQKSSAQKRYIKEYISRTNFEGRKAAELRIAKEKKK